MPEKPDEKLLMPDRNARPEGFWSLPGGVGGICGSVSGVNAALDALDKVPSHQKDVLKAEIAALLEGTDFNYVKVLARAAVNKTETNRHIVGYFDIEVSKKNL